MNYFDEYDEAKMEQVHQQNIRNSKEALLKRNEEDNIEKNPIKPPSKWYEGAYVNKKSPRKVHDHEISGYQGFGDTKAMQRAQSRKRTQVRRREASVWDNLAPKEMHTTLNLIVFGGFVLFLVILAAVRLS
tara:strand:+ start:1087 stop:1479 length:393 start_codon:yes stop_codon:yes gene_type:complete